MQDVQEEAEAPPQICSRINLELVSDKWESLPKIAAEYTTDMKPDSTCTLLGLVASSSKDTIKRKQRTRTKPRAFSVQTEAVLTNKIVTEVKIVKATLFNDKIRAECKNDKQACAKFDSFVKIKVFGQRQCKKTAICFNSDEPVWNESFCYSPTKLSSCSSITFSLLNNNDFNFVEIGSCSTKVPQEITITSDTTKTSNGKEDADADESVIKLNILDTYETYIGDLYVQFSQRKEEVKHKIDCQEQIYQLFFLIEESNNSDGCSYEISITTPRILCKKASNYKSLKTHSYYSLLQRHDSMKHDVLFTSKLSTFNDAFQKVRKKLFATNDTIIINVFDRKKKQGKLVASKKVKLNQLDSISNIMLTVDGKENDFIKLQILKRKEQASKNNIYNILSILYISERNYLNSLIDLQTNFIKPLYNCTKYPALKAYFNYFMLLSVLQEEFFFHLDKFFSSVNCQCKITAPTVTLLLEGLLDSYYFFSTHTAIFSLEENATTAFVVEVKENKEFSSELYSRIASTDRFLQEFQLPLQRLKHYKFYLQQLCTNPFDLGKGCRFVLDPKDKEDVPQKKLIAQLDELLFLIEQPEAIAHSVEDVPKQLTGSQIKKRAMSMGRLSAITNMSTCNSSLASMDSLITTTKAERATQFKTPKGALNTKLIFRELVNPREGVVTSKMPYPSYWILQPEDAITWLTLFVVDTTEEAVDIMQKFVDVQYINPFCLASFSTTKSTTFSLDQIYVVSQPKILNDYNLMQSGTSITAQSFFSANIMPRSSKSSLITTVGDSLAQLLSLYEAFYNIITKFTTNAISLLQYHPGYMDFVDLLLEFKNLGQIQKQLETPAEVFCFFVNLHNLLMLHSLIIVSHKIDSIEVAKLQLETRFRYKIGTSTVTAAEILYHMLTSDKNKASFSQKLQKKLRESGNDTANPIFNTKLRNSIDTKQSLETQMHKNNTSYIIHTKEDIALFAKLVNFACFNPTRACAPVAIYYPETFVKQVKKVVGLFFATSISLRVVRQRSAIVLPKICKFIYRDFGDSYDDLLKEITPLICDENLRNQVDFIMNDDVKKHDIVFHKEKDMFEPPVSYDFITTKSSLVYCRKIRASQRNLISLSSRATEFAKAFLS